MLADYGKPFHRPPAQMCVCDHPKNQHAHWGGKPSKHACMHVTCTCKDYERAT